MKKQYLIGKLIYFFSVLLNKSYKTKIYMHPDVKPDQPYIYVFWHGNFFLPIMVVSKFNQKKIAGLVSPSKDGEILSTWIKSLGFKPVRGSSNKKGAQGLTKLIELAKKDYCIGIAADGPRGPIFHAKSGTAYLALKTGLPILPIGVAHLKSKKFKSWDRFTIPKPFTKNVVYLNKPMFIDSKCDLTEKTQFLEMKLHAANAHAEIMLNDAQQALDEASREVIISHQGLTMAPTALQNSEN